PSVSRCVSDDCASTAIVRSFRAGLYGPLFKSSVVWVISPGMSGGMRVVFNGVRGSTPCAGSQYARYGGHSSNVAIEREGAPPILFDLGTGLRPYAARCEGVFHGSVLLSHLHWDHMQGLPFFTPLHCD